LSGKMATHRLTQAIFTALVASVRATQRMLDSGSDRSANTRRNPPFFDVYAFNPHINPHMEPACE